jgi:hypothetical protein
LEEVATSISCSSQFYAIINKEAARSQYVNTYLPVDDGTVTICLEYTIGPTP